MNLINETIHKNMSTFTTWIDTTPTPQIIDSVTYDIYENSNPFRKNYTEAEINNKSLRIAANTTAAIGAEMFSVFANPYYLSHKITNIPTTYKQVVETYQKYSKNKKENVTLANS